MVKLVRFVQFFSGFVVVVVVHWFISSVHALMEYVTYPGTATEGITDFGGFVEWVGGWVSGSVWEGRCMFAAHLD